MVAAAEVGGAVVVTAVAVVAVVVVVVKLVEVVEAISKVVVEGVVVGRICRGGSGSCRRSRSISGRRTCRQRQTERQTDDDRTDSE